MNLEWDDESYHSGDAYYQKNDPHNYTYPQRPRCHSIKHYAPRHDRLRSQSSQSVGSIHHR